MRRVARSTYCAHVHNPHYCIDTSALAWVGRSPLSASIILFILKKPMKKCSSFIWLRFFTSTRWFRFLCELFVRFFHTLYVYMQVELHCRFVNIWVGKNFLILLIFLEILNTIWQYYLFINDVSCSPKFWLNFTNR